jgi:polysaccharide export outer membrane protein
MKQSWCFLLAIAAAGLAPGQQQAPPQFTTHMGAGATTFADTSNLPVERVGIDDLLGISVYDSPELTRTVRVGYDGAIRLPMVKQRIVVVGLYPADLETAIAAELVKEQILVDPIVTVSVVEYRSRPISVVGAVKAPLTFQATGTVTLLDAIARAGGLADDAGLEILVSSSQPEPGGPAGKAATLVQRVPVKGLISATDLALNLSLHGGEEIRVPEAGRIFVVGDVKKPGAFPLTDGAESSVLKALALSEGLAPYAANTAYIYRTEGGTGGKSEIPIELRKMIERKAPDVPLMANDIVYIPDNSSRRNTLGALKASLLIGTGLGGALIYTLR